MSVKTKKILAVDNVLKWLFVGGGLVGFAASFILTLDKIKILQDPHYVPPCNINPILSCGSVMVTSQASLFGFANSLIGIAGFAALIAVGMALFAGARFNRWFWLAVQAGATLGVLFVHWLIYQSLYQIGTLCPYCMAVWAVTIPIFAYVSFFNIQKGYLPGIHKENRAVAFVLRHHGDLVLFWFLIIGGLIMHRFWYYFGF